MIFQFKQFSIRQRDSAMKIGTDGLLLATTTPLSKSSLKVLDVGSGTGLISLVIAQRAPEAKITAIEIEENAARESELNFTQSPFAERLKVLNSSFQDFNSSETFDLIICNPPFYDGSQAEGSRKQARNSVMLPLDELAKGVSKLLIADGQFSLIIPSQSEQSFIETATRFDLYPSEILRIRGRKDSKIIRSIIHFKKEKREVQVNEMHIEVDKRHEYSEDYINLTKDFLTIFD